MWKRLLLLLWGLSLWGCEYTGYEDIRCSTSTECPTGSVCRSGFCAIDGEPQPDMPEDEGEDTVVATVTVAPNASLNVGETVTMTATARNRSGDVLESVQFIWSSQDTAVATVSNGVVSAVGPGTTNITALAEGASGSASVTVLNPPASVEVVPATRVMGVNTMFTFSAVVRDVNGDELSLPVQWESSNTNVLTISAAGVATGVGEGQATIRAGVNNDVFGLAEVDVQIFEANVLELDPPSLTLRQGATEPIVAYTYYRDGDLDFEILGEPVQFALSSPAVGSISDQEDQGRRVAIFTANSDNEGTVTLTATLRTLEVTAEITVYEPVVTQVTVTPQDPTVLIGDEQVFTAVLLDQEGDVLVQPVTWSVDAASVASIDPDTGVAQALGPGQVVVTATANGVSGTSTMTVAEFGASQVSAGWLHTCAISLAGFGYCWGRGNEGRLGYGSNSSSSLPVRVSGERVFSQIVAADQHSCGISQNLAYCWGRSNDGRLGRGATGSDENTPVAVADAHEFVQISGLNDHTCGVTIDDAIYCWGVGGDGRLGDNDSNNKNTPVLVADPTGRAGIKWVMVSAGGNHTCALSNSNEVFCWGNNGRGRLGDGTTDARNIPTAVDVSGLGVTFDWVGVGEGFSCAKTPAGALYCWGDNENGRLGIDSTGDEARTPQLVAGNHLFVKVAVGRSHACATTAANTYCWGSSANGRLGGAAEDQRVPFLVPNAPAYMHLDAGGGHACGVRLDNRVECFGLNDNGQIGVNNQDPQPAPTVVWP